MKLLAFLLLGMFPATAFAFSLDQISIRKAFDGGKDENLPGQIEFVNPPKGPDFFDIAVAAKLSEWQPDWEKTVLLYPTIGWVRSTEDSSETNKLTYKAAVEAHAMTWMFLLAKVGGMSDFENDKTALTTSLELTPYLDRKWGPGPPITWGQKRIGRYIPYFGLEYFDNLPITKGGKVLSPAFAGTLLPARLYVELYPLPTIVPAHSRVELIVEYTHRWRLGGNDVDANMDHVAVNVHLYADDQRRFALGYSFEDGQNPTRNFAHYKRSAVGLRVRL